MGGAGNASIPEGGALPGSDKDCEDTERALSKRL